MRQKLLARELLAGGDEVQCTLLGEDSSENICECVSETECVILPLPLMSKDGALNAPFAGRRVEVAEISGALKPGQLVFAGKPDAAFVSAAENHGAAVVDYGSREEFAVLNAALTAEGALGIIISETPFSLSGAKILVSGFGRIGRALCLRLRLLGASVTALVRRCGSAAEAEAIGISAAYSDELPEIAGTFSVIANTVPERIFGEDIIRRMNPEALYLELASAPGGADMESLRRFGVRAVPAPGLPGKTAPASAARAVRDTVYGILREQGSM